MASFPGYTIVSRIHFNTLI